MLSRDDGYMARTERSHYLGGLGGCPCHAEDTLAGVEIAYVRLNAFDENRKLYAHNTRIC
jgi:hypothetical protein